MTSVSEDILVDSEWIFLLHKIRFSPSKDKVFVFTLAILLYETLII